MKGYKKGIIIVMTNIDLSKIKLLVLDFDNTVALHRDMQYEERRSQPGAWGRYFKEAYLHPESFYDTFDVCLAPEYMRKFVDFMKARGTAIYCVSGVSHSLNAEAKQCFVAKHYGEGIRLLTASAQTVKPEVVSVLCDVHNCSPNEVLCIDDQSQTVDLFKRAGYKAILRHEVEELAYDGYRICVDEVNSND